jgi:hypothetical protein
MIEIIVEHVEQLIEFRARIRRTITDYVIRSTLEDPSQANLALAEPDGLPPIRIQAPYEAPELAELRLQYRLFQRPLESKKEESVVPAIPGQMELPCTVLPLDVVQRVLETSLRPEYRFALIIDEPVDIERLTTDGMLEIQSSPGEEIGAEVVRVMNHVHGPLGRVPVYSFVHVLGDLREFVIREPRVIGVPEHQWHIQIDDLEYQLNAQEYNGHIERALALPGLPFLDRLPSYLTAQFPQTAGRVLTVKIVIEELLTDRAYLARFRRTAPERDLFHRTNNAALDGIILRTQIELLRRGLPFGQEHSAYQRVLAQLLQFRRMLAVGAQFADPEALRRSERDFHNSLYNRLGVTLEFGDPIVYEVTTGNSRVDLLIANLPTELKLERREGVTTEEIIHTYMAQAADYVSRCESQLGFLVVLDAVPERDVPMPPAEQDVLVVDVLTASGRTVPVIGIVMRLPRRSSELS